MINLKRIVLVNWYTFSKLDIELRGSTAIIGPNGAGKSSLQDAIQVVLTGNNKNLMALNASSDVVSGTRSSGGSSSGKRSVYSYCRGVIMGDTLRPACTTYLALVFERESDGRVWTAGIGLACTEDEPTEQVLGVFIAPDQDLTTADFLHTDEEGQVMPLAFQDIEEALKRSEKQIRIERKRDLELEITRNPSKFTSKLLVALRAAGNRGHADDGRFMRTLRNALRFKEMGSANQFIRDFVLEDDKLPIESLRESVRTWKDILSKIELLEKQQDEAQKLVALYQNLVDKLDDQMIFGWVHRAAEFQSASNDVDRFGKALADCEAEIVRLKALVDYTAKQIDNTNKGINQLELALLNNKTEQQLQLIENVQLPQAEQLFGNADKNRLDFLKLCANAALKASMILPLPGIDSKAASCSAMLKQLKERIDGADGIEAVEIDRHLKALKAPLLSYIEDLGLAGASLNERLSEINRRQHELQDQRQIINAGKTMVGSSTSKLIDMLGRAGIEATPLAELVEVTDPEWLNAVESLLGPAREALIVQPSDAQTAITLLRQNKSDYVGCQIVNTTKSGDFDRDPTGGNLAAVVTTDNRHARAFINRRLDNIQCVLTEHELLASSRAVTPDCLYASNGSIEVRQMPRNHILGKGAGQRNLPLIEAEITDLSAEHAKAAEKNRHYRSLAQGLQAFVDKVEGISFEALDQQFSSCDREMKRLKSQVLSLSDERPHEQHQQLQDLKSDREALSEQKKEDEDLLAKQYTALGTARSRLEIAEERKANTQRIMGEQDIEDVRTRQRAERELRELLKTMSLESAASESVSKLTLTEPIGGS